MDNEEEKARGFKVDDRRRFSAEGELKPEHRESAKRGADQPAAAAQVAATEASPPAPEAVAGIDRQAGALGPTPEITFATFVVGLSTQALMHLGEIPDPQGGLITKDLAAAQQLIDIIGMLKEKTRGNLDHDEQALLDAILFDLRMKYVERARPASH